MILSAVAMVIKSIAWIKLGGAWLIYGVLMGIAAVPIVLGAALYISWRKADSADTRAGLTKACMMVILAQSCAIGLQVVMLILKDETFD